MPSVIRITTQGKVKAATHQEVSGATPISRISTP